MASADVTAALPIHGLSYADAAGKDAPNGDAPTIDLTNGTHDENTKPNGEKAPQPPTPGEYVGQGLDTAPRSPVKGHKKVSSRGSRGQLRPPLKEQKKMETEDKVVYENWNGSGHLTSVRPSDDYEESLRLDEIEKTRNAAGEIVLKSGRIPSAGWEQSGIRFAPLNVPLKRRLQTAMVLAHTLMAFVLVANFFFLAAIPLTWPFLFPYIIYVLLSQSSSDGSLRERSEWFRKQKIWSLFASYFPARLHRTEELTPTRKYIFGYHPHGIISHGAFAAFATEALGFDQLFPGITNSLLTLDSNFRIPFYRDYLLRLGLSSVSKESCINLLTKGGPNNEGMGRAITIVVGGARESLGTKPGTLRLVLNCRKGFVKLAVETGSDLVPVLCFGENDIYDQLDPSEHPALHKFQLMTKKIFGFTTPVFHARGVFNYDVGIMPYRRPMNIVVGRAIKVEQQKTPDFDYVNKIHSQYVKELQLIWDTWKDDFAPERVAEMEIVE